ncbi:DEAD/DEAH box helicase [Streptomyces sp. NPDC018031]|uniref:DEAD/DEAH box helicase n=1 Tax=Streptomyces sp. NPDC018031 TaxID=3365033 RepID=UPI0037A39153
MPETRVDTPAALDIPPPRQPAGPAAQSLYWLKTTDPDARIEDFGPDTDVRVLVPEDERFHPLRDRLAARGIPVRGVRYLLERELLTGTTADGDLVWRAAPAHPAQPGAREMTGRGSTAAAAREAFEALWQAQLPDGDAAPSAVPAEDLVPAAWLPYLPHPALNPAQAQAAPTVLSQDENLLVVAPTGAGKTTIGMLAALRAVLGEKRKAAWLVPQRSLTDELDRELDGWRRRGLRVERLSGEYSVDVQRVRDADLWVTTTEKYEVLCRTSALRDALTEVGCLIVDEIHLLGDPERGAVLEALLARVRDGGSTVRMVGLSATVSNAPEVAEWLRARLVRIAWRPATLTWQLPVVPAHADWRLTQAARTRVTNAIVDTVTRDGGSVLVFCGSKHSVRSTALALAAARGADTTGVRPDDVERLRKVCDAAGIGLHYKDWEHKRAAERAFRSRETDVLVATSTVAAGVNLPARAVVVRDTQVGTRDVDVATVQQMFGRAGRVGAGETAGWAFLIVDQAEHETWRQRLVGGYTVVSQILSSLPDHVLAEVVQQRVRTRAEAEKWWLSTFAHHQGSTTVEPLRRAVGFLVGADYLGQAGEADGGTLTATELGTLTARVMVPTATGYQLRTALSGTPVPRNAEDAERQLIEVIATAVPKLARASLSESLKPRVALLLQAEGHLSRVPGTAGPPDFSLPYAPGDLARASLLAVANSPREFAVPRREFARIPHSAMYPVLEDAPRYLHWLGSQGYGGTVHPWVAIVAADLNRRVRWRRCAPPRGSGRLLWMCEQMATGVHADQEVPAMWQAARERGVTGPDWTSRTPPRGCRLDGASYAALLAERVTDGELATGPDGAPVSRSTGRALTAWSGRSHLTVHTRQRETTPAFPPPGGDGDAERGVALFSWRGDYRATGWLAEYSAVARRA